jgi:UDP-hydrolysing UDP-N-acetyl-D-glucosamine 2-epimerase
MEMNRTICIITGSRAEYGLLYWLMKEIEEDPDLTLQIIATGMHLSPEFGLTYRVIEEDGFTIDEKVEVLLSGDTPIAIAKSMGLGIIGFADSFKRLNPDMVVVLGDRYEIFAACSTALTARLPIVHIHGGEATKGLIDDALRHSITKMAHIHFTSTERSRNRVIQMGERPERVFCYGAPGLDNIRRFELLERNAFEQVLDFQMGETNLLITFHPVTLDNNSAEKHFRELLEALDHFSNTKLLFTKSNADTEGRIINRMIDNYVMKNNGRAIAFESLGQRNYLSALQYVNMVVGNSSSGLIEAPSFKIPTVNIGDRQEGREQAQTVIQCDPQKESILQALQKGFSSEFRNSIKQAVNPYGDGKTSPRIKNKLKEILFRDDGPKSFIKKDFYEIGITQ